METKLPAIQAEQVADDMAPVTAEYVPAKASDEEYGPVDLNASVSVNITKQEGNETGARWGGGRRRGKEKSYGETRTGERGERGREEERCETKTNFLRCLGHQDPHPNQ